VASALQWVERNRERFGGPEVPLLLWGQSAGASHVASWLFDDEARGGGTTAGLAGVMLMSGFYCVEDPLPAGPRAYFGDDPSLYAGRAPLSHVRAVSVPLWIGVAEFDPGWIAHQTYALAQALTKVNGRSPDFNFMRGHNHVSTVQSLGSVQQDLASMVLRFVQSAASAAATGGLDSGGDGSGTRPRGKGDGY
jgi:alpha-beta hydrolase superfamily lysophospholipase